jgi:cyclopropane-fatty-acyl-phospholipid synthase
LKPIVLNQEKPNSRKFFLPESLARRAVLGLLSRLQKDCLIVEENDQLYCFGEDRNTAKLVASITVKDPSAWLAVFHSGSLGAGEAYMQDSWETPDLLKVIRVFVRNMAMLGEMDDSASLPGKLGAKLFHWLRRNTLDGSRRNIAAHYDLSNDFFRLFLDRSMAYSAGIFRTDTATLEEASIEKFRNICERLQLQPEDHLLEIGTGWGGLAIYAARHYGCRVTTTTISKEQHRYAVDWVNREGLQDRITLLLKDYRELEGSFDKLVSVEMIEAVGPQYYATYFSKCSSLLKTEGLMLIQAITISDQRFEYSCRNTDFIKRYIFPGGQLPSNAVICRHLAEDTDMQLIGLEDITRDYALTLKAWHERFNNMLPEVRKQGFNETFIRMWRFYLAFCEGGFRERVIHTAQFLMAKPGYRNLLN